MPIVRFSGEIEAQQDFQPVDLVFSDLYQFAHVTIQRACGPRS